MLKNKYERKKFLENDFNWLLIEDLESTIGMRVYEIQFDDQTSLLKFTHFIEDLYDKTTKEICEGYRVLNERNKTLSSNVFSISYCINYIAKRNLK